MASHRLGAALLLAFVVSALMPAPVAAAIQTVTITASADPLSPAYGAKFTVTATVTADGPADDASSPYGTVKWYAKGPGISPDLVGTATLSSGQTDVSVPDRILSGSGSHELWANFETSNPAYYNATSVHFFVTVGKSPSTTTLTGPTTVEADTDFTLEATTSSDQDDNTGSIDFYRVGNPTPLCSFQGGSQVTRWCGTQLSSGTAEYYVVYSGATLVEGSTSETLAVTAGPNIVHASGVGVQYATFYPVKDNYRDTVKIQGGRLEEIGVMIKIFSPSGQLIKSVALALNSGPYSWIWTGRKSDGSIYPEGKYKVVQTLKDATNATKAYTNYVTLSKKRLIWHAASSTKSGSAFSASGRQGSGSVTVGSGYVRLKSGDPYTTWAGAGWQFTLVAGVSYRNIAVQVYATHGFSAGSMKMGSQNFAVCAFTSSGEWGEGCFDAWKSLAGQPGSFAWTNSGTLTASHRSGTKVRSMVSVRGGTVDVYKARVTYQYATLGY